MINIIPLVFVVGGASLVPNTFNYGNQFVYTQSVSTSSVNSLLDSYDNITFNISNSSDYFNFTDYENITTTLVDYKFLISSVDLNLSIDNNIRNLSYFEEASTTIYYDEFSNEYNIDNNSDFNGFNYNVSISISSDISYKLLNTNNLYFYWSLSCDDSFSNWVERDFLDYWSLSCCNYTFVSSGDYNTGYDNGYEQGYYSGYADGDSYGYNIGYYNGQNDGINRGYSQGYNQGLNDSDGLNKSFKTMLFTILDYPVHFVSEVFNVEFFGINLFSAFTFIITMGLIAFVIKRFL